MSVGIDYNARALTVGPTESGKSELINIRFTAIRCQKALYDSKDEFAIDGVTPARDVDAIDWRQPIIHFIPGEDARGDAQTFFTQAFQRRHLYVAVHEVGDTCEYNANGAPPAVSRYVVQGARHGLGLDAGTQRPVGNPKRVLTEAGHFFIVVPRGGADDVDTLAREMGIPGTELARQIDGVQEELGVEVPDRDGKRYSFLHWSRATRRITKCPPIPEHLRARNIVRRTSVA